MKGGLVCPHERSDMAGALLRATAKRRGGEAAMAASLVGHDASSIAPSSLLALHQNPLRHGRCRLWVRTLSRGEIGVQPGELRFFLRLAEE